jgi:hypothetical protein
VKRTHKLALYTTLALLSVITTAVIIQEMVTPQISRGSAAAPVTAAGWVQLVLSALAAAGFSGASVWQGAAALIETRLSRVIRQVMPAVPDKAVVAVVDVTKLTAFLALLRQVTDDATKAKLTEAARLACDNLRDDLFPALTSPQLPNS